MASTCWAQQLLHALPDEDDGEILLCPLISLQHFVASINMHATMLGVSPYDYLETIIQNSIAWIFNWKKRKKSMFRSHMRMVKSIERYIMTSFSYALQGNGLIINISLLMEIKPYNWFILKGLVNWCP